MQKSFYESDGRLEIALLDKSDWKLFEQIFQKIRENFDIKLINKIDGIDERYWDFEINGGLICLHLQHYLGISIFSVNDPVMNEVVKKIAEKLGEELEF